MFDGFTEKQKSFVRDVIIGDTKRINILEGSVRSGKTYVSLIAWLILLAQMPNENNYLMVGKTLTSLKRNCLSILDSIVPPKFFKYSLIKKEASIFDHKIFLEGVNDSRSEHKIRGMTLQAAYCDEITLYPEDFFTMLLSRLSQTGSKLLGTTNPDSPMHWFYQKFLTRQSEISLKTWKFLLDDNTTIETQIRNDIKKEYTGVFYERFVLGRWVQADGIIYDQFANEPEKYIISDVLAESFYKQPVQFLHRFYPTHIRGDICSVEISAHSKRRASAIFNKISGMIYYITHFCFCLVFIQKIHTIIKTNKTLMLYKSSNLFIHKISSVVSNGSCIGM